MGHRLSKIYTRTGDAGATGLGDGSRIKKWDPRIDAIGDVDELNCSIGLLVSEEIPPDIRDLLLDIQHDLFDLGGEFSIPDSSLIGGAAVAKVEAHIDHYNDELPPLKEFILPGGSRPAAICHAARAICRRAERKAQLLASTDTVNADGVRFLNRLSDLLFVLARVIAGDSGAGEVLWQRDRGSRP